MIELSAGAGDLEMQEIAHRLEELHAAIEQENSGHRDLPVGEDPRPDDRRGDQAADAHAEPGGNSRQRVYHSLHEALSAKNSVQARVEFQSTRLACMACHVAEKVALVDASAVFKRIRTLHDATQMSST